MPVGITGSVVAGLTAVGVGEATAAIAAPILIGAGTGALVSGVTGGDPLKGALIGGFTGGVGGALGAAGPASESAFGNIFGSGASDLSGVAGDTAAASGAASSAMPAIDTSVDLSAPAVSVSPLDTPIGSETPTAGATVYDSPIGPSAPGGTALYDGTDPANRGAQIYDSAIGPNAGPGGAKNFSGALSSATSGDTSPLTNAAILKALQGKKGIDSTSAILGVLAAGAQALGGPPKQGTYPLPGPSSTAATQGPYFNKPLQPFTGPGRVATNPMAGQPASSWYSYGEMPGGNFFTNNSLASYGYNPTGMAKGGRVRFDGGGVVVHDLSDAERPFDSVTAPDSATTGPAASSASAPGSSPSSTAGTGPGSNVSSYGNSLGALGTAASLAGMPGLGVAGTALGTAVDAHNANQSLASIGAPSLSFGDYLSAALNNATFGTFGQSLDQAIGNLDMSNTPATGGLSTSDPTAANSGNAAGGMNGVGESAAGVGTGDNTGGTNGVGESAEGASGWGGDSEGAGSGDGGASGDGGDGDGSDGEAHGGLIGGKRKKKGALNMLARAKGGRIRHFDAGGTVVPGASAQAQAYYDANPDVAQEFLAHASDPGWGYSPDEYVNYHFQTYGTPEGRLSPTGDVAASGFGNLVPQGYLPPGVTQDKLAGAEQDYLTANPDIDAFYKAHPELAAMPESNFALQHFYDFGQTEKRPFGAQTGPVTNPPPPAPTTPDRPAPFVPAAAKPLPGENAWSPDSSHWFDSAGNFVKPGMADGGFFAHLARGGVLGYAPLIHALAKQRHFSTGGGEHYVQGAGDGQADLVPAQLSDGEFVVDATTVARIGNGSNRKGAQALEGMRRAVARDAGSKRVVQKKIKKSPLQYLAEARR